MSAFISYLIFYFMPLIHLVILILAALFFNMLF